MPLYLDCWTSETGGCHLKWGLQALDGGRDPIANTLLQYRETEDNHWTPVPGTVQGNTHNFSGTESSSYLGSDKCR